MSDQVASADVHTSVFNVEMTCEGCSGAVNRVLKKLAGVETIDIDMAAQRVAVTGTASMEAMLAAIQKTGKPTSYLEERA